MALIFCILLPILCLMQYVINTCQQEYATKTTKVLHDIEERL